MSSFQIRPGEQKDLDRLSYLYSQAFPGYLFEPVQFEFYLKMGYGFLFVSTYREVVVGYILGHFNPDESYCHISSLAVHSFYRRKGVARNLMQDILDKSRQKNLSKVKLSVHAQSSPAINLYQSLGFVVGDKYEGGEGKAFLEMEALLAS